MPSARQTELLRAVHAHQEAHGRPPTFRLLLEALHVSSLNTINCLVRPLLRDGLLERSKYTTRSLRLTSAGRRAIGAPCCGCSECRCSCHATPNFLPKTAASVMRNLRAGPADGESLEAFAVRLQRMIQREPAEVSRHGG